MSLTGQVGVVTTNPGWYGRWVQKITRSDAFHTVYAISDTEVVSAETPTVIIRPIGFFADVQWTDVTYPTPAHLNDAVRFVRAQVGKPYAYFDILLLFIAELLKEHTPWFIKTRLTDNGQWFCSELSDAGLLAGEVNLFPTRPPSAVIPKDFLDIVTQEHAKASDQ